MTAKKIVWTVRLSRAAENDFLEILQWTSDQFSPAQAHIYARTLSLAIEALTSGPTLIGGKWRDEIGLGIFSLHVAHSGRKGRHFLLCRVKPSDMSSIDILRILHDAMDLPRHLPPDDKSDS